MSAQKSSVFSTHKIIYINAIVIGLEKVLCKEHFLALSNYLLQGLSYLSEVEASGGPIEFGKKHLNHHN